MNYQISLKEFRISFHCDLNNNSIDKKKLNKNIIKIIYEWNKCQIK